jgi:hypothetical protein
MPIKIHATSFDRCESEIVRAMNLPRRKQVSSDRDRNHNYFAPSRGRGNERSEKHEHENEIGRAIAMPGFAGRGLVCALV